VQIFELFEVALVGAPAHALGLQGEVRVIALELLGQKPVPLVAEPVKAGCHVLGFWVETNIKPNKFVGFKRTKTDARERI
jgi:hypothetical protein